MRLSTQQRSIIFAIVAEIFGTDARVWLFGSRMDDRKRGGDIDLLIETSQVDVAAIMRAEIAFQIKLQAQLGDQKIDVLLDYPSRKSYPPIFKVAKQTGILLRCYTSFARRMARMRAQYLSLVPSIDALMPMTGTTFVPPDEYSGAEC